MLGTIGLRIMSQNEFLQGVVAQAEEKEKNYLWLEAVDLYNQALQVIEKGEVQEKVGYAFYRAAMQAESVDEFRERMRQAVANYEKANELYGMVGEQGKKPRVLRCDAVVAFLGYWLASEVSEKKRLLDECWRIAKEALKAFEEAEDALEYGETYNQLSSSAYHRYIFEWSFQTREKIIREAIEYGEKTINLLSSVGGSHELARAYVKTAIYLATSSYFVSDMDEKERYRQKSLDCWQKATELSEETASLELLAMSDKLR